MELPVELKNVLEACSSEYRLSDLKKSAQKVSDTYRTAARDGSRLVVNNADVVSYALTRMPATFGAVSAVLENVQAAQTLLDVGAGTGAATWAALQMGKVTQALCLEREDAMRTLGKRLMKDAFPDVKWQAFDLAKDELKLKADMVIASYVLNELDEKARGKAAEKLWLAAGQTLVIIEPGTPAGFKILNNIRTYLIEKGAYLLAPCSHMSTCLLAQDDWCHFTCRVARSKIHKALKSGDAPFEDEKFSYLVLSRTPQALPSRILRHPRIEKGNVTLQLCTKEGLQTKTISKKDGVLFKAARKANAGDDWPLG